ncbi:sorting nexin-7 isoform X1 [Anolis carolinensis]
MPTSPSSMINQYKFEDEPESKDLFITVDDPESHVTAIETFITYRVVTKTTRGEFDSSEYEVRRRYQDFLWLKGRLEEAHPTLIIPPLPEKFIMKGVVERFNDKFIETRKKALHKFLNRIADHPTLTFNEDFKIFLTAQAWELSSHKKQGPGLFSRMGQTVKAVASSMRGGAVKNRPEVFSEMIEYVDIFSQKISLLDKISHRVHKEEKDYLYEMKEFGPIHTLWSASEEDLVDTLKGLAGCIDQCCKATEKRMTALSESLFPAIQEYLLYSEILMGVLKRRDQIQAELDAKIDAVYNKKIENDLVSRQICKMQGEMSFCNQKLDYIILLTYCYSRLLMKIDDKIHLLGFQHLLWLPRKPLAQYICLSSYVLLTALLCPEQRYFLLPNCQRFSWPELLLYKTCVLCIIKL